jgi:methylisocitrate lyase
VKKFDMPCALGVIRTLSSRRVPTPYAPMALAKPYADLVMLFPNTAEEARKAPAAVKAPLIFVNSEGNRLGRPIFPIGDLEAMGYKMVNDAISAITTMFQSVKDLFVRLKKTGRTGMDPSVFMKVRKDLEDTIGLEEYYRIEEQTVENKS